MLKNIFLLFILATLLPALPAQAQKADRSEYPTPGPVKGLELPAIQSFELQNGLPVYLVSKSDIPVAQFILAFNAGSIYDPADKLGLARMTADMMDEGAGERDALALSEEIDFLGINLFTYAGQEQLSIRLFSPVSKLDQALPLMSDILLHPQFNQSDLDRKRTEALVDMAQAHDEPRAIASAAFQQLIFGKEHPYGRPENGTEASLRSMTTDNLKEFHQEFITPANGYLVVVGDLTKSDVQEKLEPLFQNWTGGTKKKVSIPKPASYKGMQVFIVDQPEAAQTELRFGQPAVSRHTKDYYPIEVMNTILGGSFTSRLNQNIREEHGYAYGAGSYFFEPSEPGFFLAYAAVQTDVTGAAVQEFMKELRGINEVSAAEVEKAKNYQALSFPGEFERVEQIAGNVSNIVFYDLPMDYLNQHVQNLLAVTKGQVEQAAEKYIRPDQMILVAVGDRAQIEEEIQKLNLGKLHILTKEEVLGPVPEVKTQP